MAEKNPIENNEDSVIEKSSPDAPASLVNTTLYDNVMSSVNSLSNIILPQTKPYNIDYANNVRGNYETGPNPGLKNKNGTEDYIRSLANYSENLSPYFEDKYAYGKERAFGSGWKQQNFDRYYAHPSYKKLGFNPWRDNETVYNQNSSWMQDFFRATKTNMFFHGFGSDIESDADSSEAFEKANTIYGSRRGGIGASIANLSISAQYAQGIAARIVVEDLILALALPATGGGSGVVAATETGRLGKQLWNAVESIGNTQKVFKSLDTIADTRNFWKTLQTFEKPQELFKASAKGISSYVGRNTTEFFSSANRMSREYKELSEFGKVFRGASAMYRDVREIRMALAEAGTEAGSVKTKIINDLTDRYFAEHGYNPEGKDLDTIWQTANKAASATKLMNTGLIHASNKIVFEQLFKGFKSASGLRHELSEGALGSIGSNKTWKVGQDVYSDIQKSFGKKTFNALFKSSFSPISKQYLLGNLTEGLQESFQDVIAQGMEKYYEDVYTNTTQTGFYDAMGYMGRAAGNQFNMQGLETFMSGLMMGAMIQPQQHFVMNTLPKWKKQIFNNKEYQSLKKQKEENRKANLESVNNVLKNPDLFNTQYVDYLSEVDLIAREMKTAEEQGDEKAYKDAKNKLVYNHLYNVLRSGNMEFVSEHFERMTEMTDAELADAWNDKAENGKKIRARIEKTQAKLNKLNDGYKAINRLFGNPFDPNRYDKTKKPVEYATEQNRYMAYEEAKKDALFAKEAMDNTMARMQEVFGNLVTNKPLSKASSADFTILADVNQMDIELDTLKNEIGILNQGDSRDKAKGKKKQAKYDSLKDLLDGIKHYRTALTLVQSGVKSSFEKKAQAQKNALLKKGGYATDKNGKEYFIEDVLGTKVRAKDKAGNLILTNRNNLTAKDSLDTPGIKQTDDAFLIEATENLYNQYKKYLTSVAAINDEQLFDDKIDSSFIQFRDYYHLNVDNKRMGNVVNILHNPEKFVEYAKRMADVRKTVQDKRASFFKVAYSKYEDNQDLQQLFNGLYDLSLFLPSEQVDKVLRGEFPVLFQNVIDNTDVTINTNKELFSQGVETVRLWRENLVKSTQEAKAAVEAEELAKKEATLKKPEVATVITAEMRESLIKLGYDNEDIDRMIPGFAQDILNSGEQKKQEVPKKEDQEKLVSETKAEPSDEISTDTSKGVAIKHTDSFEVFEKHPDLLSTLILRYREYSQEREASGNTALIGKDYTDEDVAEHSGFRSWIKFSKTVKNEIESYNKQHNLEDVKEQKEKIDTDEQVQEIWNRLDKIDTKLEELDKLTDDLFRLSLAENIDTTALDAAIEKKRQELWRIVSLSKIEVGDILLPNKSGQFKEMLLVVKKEEDGIWVVTQNNLEGEPQKIPHDIISKEINYIYTKGMEKNIQETITPEERLLGEQSLKNNIDMHNTKDKEMDEITNKALSEKSEKIDDDFDNNFNDNCK